MIRNVNNLVKFNVRANDGDVGAVEQFYFDNLTWIIRYMAVNTGGRRLGRTVLISLAALGKPDWEARVFPVNLTMTQVRDSPKTDIAKPVSRRHEIELHEHYAWPVYWGGGFYVPPGFTMTSLFPDVVAEEEKPPSPSSGVRKVDPGLRSTRDVTRCRVHADDGNIGHVADCLVNDGTWAIRYLVVNTCNWLPDRRVLVSPRWITSVNWADKKVFVDLTRDAVTNSPAYDLLNPVGPDYEGKLLGHLQKPDTTGWVVFKFHAPPGAEVHVAGTFNNWDPTAIKLGDNGKGVYTATVLLPLGRYEYKFVVNGTWQNGRDGGEQIPNAYGTTNEVLIVGHTAVHDGHLHTFSRPPGDERGLLWSTPMGG